MVKQLRTDARLLSRLNEASKTRLTSRDRHLQRISFIMGSLPNDSTITRQQVEAVLREHDTTVAA